MIALKLAAIPAVVWLASWAGRRWGHRVSGLISGFPLISGPVLLFVAADATPAFVAEASFTTMAAAPSVGVHCLVYSWMARVTRASRWQWVICLLAAWAGCVGASVLLSGMVIPGPIGLALSIAEMLVLAALMPRVRAHVGIPGIPPTEIVVRMLAALLVAAAVMFGAEAFGPRVSGILLAFPITASVLPVFTLALYGADATVRLLSGFVTGLLGFVAYFFVFGALVRAHGIALACGVGVLASLAMVSGAVAVQRRLARTEASAGEGSDPGSASR